MGRYTERRTWAYVEPGDDGGSVVKLMTEGEVLAFYWDWWSGEMRRQGKRGINPDACVEDWVTVYWAERQENA